ncbi:xylose isomerase [Cnuibacter physcomitrellae]|uniref:Sugar phosphate isomerase n=1 Tax=Cnuibacter physcomitrellae TaxID=1619308 RepID=A0A1X9LQW9_9MICO|nr:sugar phosphate isomerase/epimerase [Cnuibacter physcomitrellae]ARJ04300.1 sugar phosphate isomerase [Cnuibacter physcomitrellae]GGI40716.1 xylose isomerase [Cnuibacter physcomitrellae]
MIRWGYAINQFKPQFDDFVRRRQHRRALQVIAASGFTGVELSAGSGRWEPLGNPRQIEANFGSIAGFGEFVRAAALDSVSSWYWDPALRLGEDLTHGDDPLDPSARDGLVGHATWFATALAELGGDVLVVRPAPLAGQSAPLDEAAIRTLAESWQAVAAALEPLGVKLALHVDFLSSLRRDDGLERLLAASDASVGLALDTAELTIAGIDPIDLYRRHADRVVHVHLKNAAAVDDVDDYLLPAGDFTVLRAGGSRAVPRWFTELATEPLLVDSPAFVRALAENGYDGWVVVESDLSPHPPTSTMLNGWEVQHVLAPLAAGG